MANDKTFKWVFSSALTKIEEATGEFDRDAFHKQVAPLCGKIMQIDGVARCNIARYGVEVTILIFAADEDAVKKRVVEIFEKEAIEADFFPLRSSKKVKLNLEE